MARDISIGIIGVGQIGKHHIEQYKKVPHAKIVAVADINREEAERVAAMHGIGAVYVNFRELLRRDDIEAVDVCLHNNFHAPVTIAALEAGKHVYCEKPIAGSYADGLRMVETARRCGRRLSIQLSTLFAKETKIAKRLIAAGMLGKIYHGRSTGFRRRGRPFVDGYGTANFVNKRTASGGALIDMGVYHIAQILYLLGQPTVERISGRIYQEIAMDEERRRSSGYDVEELGMGFVRFAGGLTLDIIESWAIHLNGLEGSCVVGSLGGIRLHPFGFYSTVQDVAMDATFDLDSADWRWHQLRPTEWAWDSPQHNWVAGLLGVAEALPTAEIALQTMLISEGIYLSDRLGREVTAEEVIAQSHSTAVEV